jgi:hypothetical protein
VSPREAARAAGQLTYKPLKACSKGHWQRYVSCGACVICAREYARSPQREEYIQGPQRKAAVAKYNSSPKGRKARARARAKYSASPKGQATNGARLARYRRRRLVNL